MFKKIDAISLKVLEVLHVTVALCLVWGGFIAGYLAAGTV